MCSIVSFVRPSAPCIHRAFCAVYSSRMEEVQLECHHSVRDPELVRCETPLVTLDFCYCPLLQMIVPIGSTGGVFELPYRCLALPCVWASKESCSRSVHSLSYPVWLSPFRDSLLENCRSIQLGTGVEDTYRRRLGGRSHAGDMLRWSDCAVYWCSLRAGRSIRGRRLLARVAAQHGVYQPALAE